jgi:hypothetical protein
MMNIMERSEEIGIPLEEIALSKARNITDVHATNFFTHGLKIESDLGHRLQSILHNGLLSRRFAERIGISITENWQGGWGEDVCINSACGEAVNEGFGYTLWGTNPIPTTSENLCVIMISTKQYYSKEWTYNSPIRGGREKNEMNWKLRIAPRNFEGLIVADVPFVNTGWPQLDQLEIAPPEVEIMKISSIMQDAYLTQPYLALPIYGTSGDLLWPIHVPSNELPKFLNPYE